MMLALNHNNVIPAKAVIHGLMVRKWTPDQVVGDIVDHAVRYGMKAIVSFVMQKGSGE